MLVHPLCEGLLLYGIPFIWGREDQLKKEEMKKMTRKPRKLLTDVSAAPPLNRSRICHLVTDLASFKREPHWCAQSKPRWRFFFNLLQIFFACIVTWVSHEDISLLWYMTKESSLTARPECQNSLSSFFLRQTSVMRGGACRLRWQVACSPWPSTPKMDQKWICTLNFQKSEQVRVICIGHDPKSVARIVGCHTCS